MDKEEKRRGKVICGTAIDRQSRLVEQKRDYRAKDGKRSMLQTFSAHFSAEKAKRAHTAASPTLYSKQDTQR